MEGKLKLTDGVDGHGEVKRRPRRPWNSIRPNSAEAAGLPVPSTLRSPVDPGTIGRACSPQKRRQGIREALWEQRCA